MKKRFMSALIAAVLCCSSAALATVSHTASQVNPGQFGAGNYSFQQSVGIGTASPGELLEVGDGGTGNNFRKISVNGGSGAGGGSGLILKRNGAAVGQYLTYGGNTYIDYQGTGNIRAGYGGTNVMTLLSSGNVGINTTSPTAMLDVKGFVRITDYASIPASLAGTELLFIPSQNKGYLQAYNRSSMIYSIMDIEGSSVLINANSAGNVGIGTASPSTKLQITGPHISDRGILHLNGTDHGFLSVDAPNGGNVGMIFDEAGSYRWVMYSAGSDADKFTLLNSSSGAKLTVTQGGNVGIGTTSPGYKLAVSGTGNYAQSIYSIATDTGITRFGLSNSARHWTLSGLSDGTFAIADESAPAQRFMIDTAGKVGVGRWSTANRLEVEGDASKTTSGSWAANSDRRIKTGIKDVTNALATIGRLRPVTFTYTDEYKRAHPSIQDHTYYNFIAQEFQTVFPESVKGSGEFLHATEEQDAEEQEILQLDPYNAQVVAIKAIQELDAQNDALAAADAAKQAQIDALTTRVAALTRAFCRDNGSDPVCR